MSEHVEEMKKFTDDDTTIIKEYGAICPYCHKICGMEITLPTWEIEKVWGV